MTQRRYNLENVKPHLAMPVHGLMDPRAVVCLVGTGIALAQRQIPHELKMNVGGSIIEQSRSLCVDNFLQSDCTHLFWLDADLTWDPGDFLKLLALATELPCVLGAYPVKDDPIKFFVNLRPDTRPNEHGCYAVEGAGLGFCCVQRRVIEELAAKAPKLRMLARPHPVAHLFRNDVLDGDFRGEDYCFFADVRALGYPVHLYPDITLGHVGPKEYRASFADLLKEKTTCRTNHPAKACSPSSSALTPSSRS